MTSKSGFLFCVGAIAAVARLANLGSFSMWLDEILETTQASTSLADLYTALIQDAVHPPLEPTLTWLMLQLGWSEHTRRLLPIALGVATVVFLTGWTVDRFGPGAGILTGVLAALSPLHVQYSQELRPYSLALFLLVLALWCMERYLAGSGRQWFAWSWVACLGCLYSQYFAGIVVLPILVMLWVDRADGNTRAHRGLRWMPGFCLLLVVAFLPWLIVAAGGLGRARAEGAFDWTWHAVGRRIEHLTVGGKEGDPANNVLIYVGLLLAFGIFRALKHREAWTVLAGALVGSVGIEFVLSVADHWTNSRYNLNSWPFLVIVLALGVEQFGLLLASQRARHATMIIMGGALCLLQLSGLFRYYEAGRPDWRSTAEAVEAVEPAESRVWTTNEWTRVCLSHYLGESSARLARLDGDISLLATPDSDTACIYVVDGGYPRYESAESFLNDQSLLFVDPGGLGARVFRVTPFDPQLDCVWNLPVAKHKVGGDTAGSAGISFGAAARQYFVSGWSHPEMQPDGKSFVWALGGESYLALGGLPIGDYLLEIELWPFQREEEAQQVAIELNHTSLGSFELQPGLQTIKTRVPSKIIRQRENVVRFRFSYSTAPHLLDPGNEDRRELSAALEHFRLRI